MPFIFERSEHRDRGIRNRGRERRETGKGIGNGKWKTDQLPTGAGKNPLLRS